MMNSVLIDTSFCIRLLKEDEQFHNNAVDYFQYFIENNIEMYLSTIVVSEYSVKNNADNLIQLKAFKLLSFTYEDAKIAGNFFNTLLKKREQDSPRRTVIINDCKLFAQIKSRGIDSFISKDINSKKMINKIQEEHDLKFEFIDVSIPITAYTGKLFK